MIYPVDSDNPGQTFCGCARTLQTSKLLLVSLRVCVRCKVIEDQK